MTPLLFATQMSALDPAGPQAAHIDTVWQVMLWVTGIVYVVVMAFFFVAIFRRTGDQEVHPAAERTRTIWVIGATIVSSVILLALLVVDVVIGRSISELPTENGVEIKLTGQQWWWKAEYTHRDLTRRFTTANELHIPVGRPVVLTLNSGDVIHSFWIPNLHGKRDMIPGKTTTIHLRADRAGTYRGQCAEYCGLQHAHMVLHVIAEPQEQFDRWYSNQVASARTPQDERTSYGQHVFMQNSCVMCHTVRGTQAGARYGPDLTHLKSRATIAAGTLPNNRGSLAGWIANPHAVKPGVNMPANTLEPRDLHALVDYLESLQ